MVTVAVPPLMVRPTLLPDATEASAGQTTSTRTSVHEGLPHALKIHARCKADRRWGRMGESIVCEGGGRREGPCGGRMREGQPEDHRCGKTHGHECLVGVEEIALNLVLEGLRGHAEHAVLGCLLLWRAEGLLIRHYAGQDGCSSNLQLPQTPLPVRCGQPRCVLVKRTRGGG
jgi:hypothetical protein